MLMAASIAFTAIADDVPIPIRTHQNPDKLERDRNPINLPIKILFDAENNLIKVWCDNDNIQAEVFVYDQSGNLEAYSSYMNVCLTLTSSNSHSILIEGDVWVAEGCF